MSDSFSTIEYCSCCSTSCVQTQDCLISKIQLWNFECFKHDLHKFFSVFLWVTWWLSKHHFVFIWRHFQFIVKYCVFKNFLKSLKILDHTIYNWILQIEVLSELNCFVSIICIFLIHTSHNIR